MPALATPSCLLPGLEVRSPFLHDPVYGVPASAGAASVWLKTQDSVPIPAGHHHSVCLLRADRHFQRILAKCLGSSDPQHSQRPSLLLSHPWRACLCWLCPPGMPMPPICSLCPGSSDPPRELTLCPFRAQNTWRRSRHHRSCRSWCRHWHRFWLSNPLGVFDQANSHHPEDAHLPGLRRLYGIGVGKACAVFFPFLLPDAVGLSGSDLPSDSRPCL